MELERYDGLSAQPHLPDFLDLYRDVYGVPPYVGDPFFTVEMYEQRLRRAFDMDGFEIVVAFDGGRVIGIGHGVTLPPAMPWWQSLLPSLRAELVEAANAGNIFWLRELQVREPFRNQGVGRELHDALRGKRSEDYVTLTVIVDNEPPRSAYLRWGYEIVGQIRHAPESPLYDAMIMLNA